MSNSFRTTALTEETATAATTSHDSSLPNRSLKASIAPLTRRSACKSDPLPGAPKLLLFVGQMPELAIGNTPFQPELAASIDHLAPRVNSDSWMRKACSAAGHAHMPADARAAVPAVDDEI